MILCEALMVCHAMMKHRMQSMYQASRSICPGADFVGEVRINSYREAWRRRSESSSVARLAFGR